MSRHPPQGGPANLSQLAQIHTRSCMTAAARSVPAIGFLTAVEHAEYGFFGGYLIVNAAGRPLEFHCTAPVKATRAQEILYGPTLRDYLYEQIAPAQI